MESYESGPRPVTLMDQFLSRINKKLLPFKLFYFFFFASFGSLFPLISIYFKQLGMSAFQSGVLVGIRPFVEFCSGPFWNHFGDKWRKGKLILLMSLASWIIFTLSLIFVYPSAEGCLVRVSNNSRMHKITPPYKNIKETDLVDEAHTVYPYKVGQSPIGLSHNNLVGIENDNDALVVPMFQSVVYKQKNVNSAFAGLLILVIIGEFFSAPAFSIADSTLLQYLENEPMSRAYGKQRMFGSLGWGLAMLFVGIALDYSTAFFNHPCKWPGHHEKNYTINFTVFSIFMFLAMITASKFEFFYDAGDDSMYLKIIKDKVSSTFRGGVGKNRGKLVNEDVDEGEQQFSAYHESNNAPQIAVSTSEHEMKQDYPPEIPDKESVVKQWIQVMKLFRTPRSIAFLFVAWFMGFGVGIVFTFLFWHLQEIGGSPTLYGVASVINHGSEIIAYYFSGKLINKIGHQKVLYLGLLGNIARFLYVSYLERPWGVLPFEFLQGLTHATSWAACCSYLTHAMPTQYRQSGQGVLQAIHHGLGKGCGCLIGGLIISRFGSGNLFRSYGVACCLVLIGFLLLNYLLVEQVLPLGGAKQSTDGQNGSATQGQDEDDTKEYLEESTYLSPHGIPFTPSNRELSSSKLNELGRESSTSGNVVGGIRPTPAPDLFAPPPANQYHMNY